MIVIYFNTTVNTLKLTNSDYVTKSAQISIDPAYHRKINVSVA